MSIVELSQYINQEAILRVEGTIDIRVVIKDVKVAYGQERMLIEPVQGAGSGSKWVAKERLIFVNRRDRFE